MATPRSGKNITVPDAHLLDDDNSGDEVVVPEDYENMFDNADQPGGKNIRIGQSGQPHTKGTPPTTPPRTSHTENPTTTNTIVIPTGTIPAGHHSIKLEIYIHTTRTLTLHKVTSTLYSCTPYYFRQPAQLQRVIERAHQLTLMQEPYHTMLESGYDLTLSKPQLSYKVIALDENRFVDFVPDMASLTNADFKDNPIPHYEFSEGRNISRTDVSFQFKIPLHEKQVRPAMRHQASITFDHHILSPIIDQFRAQASLWTRAQQLHVTNGQSTHLTNTHPMLTLADAQPPQHNTRPESPPPDRSTRPRTQERLGPPIERRFRTRSRSNERRRGDTRDPREHKYRRQ